MMPDVYHSNYYRVLEVSNMEITLEKKDNENKGCQPLFK